MKFIGKLETIVTILLGFLFLIWAYSTCKSSGTTPPDVPTNKDTAAVTTSTSAPPANNNFPGIPTDFVAATEQTASNRTAPAAATQYSTLYVLIDSLKVREDPELSSPIIDRLVKDEKVFFLEKRTEFTQKITMFGVVQDEPWVYVQSPRGQKGWVYGAGVHYYKK